MRQNMTAINESTSLSGLKGIGEKTAALYEKRGLLTVRDLIRYYPRDYEFYGRPVPVSEAEDGKKTSLLLKITGASRPFRTGRTVMLHLYAVDLSSQENLRITYFNMPYIRKNLPDGTVRVFRGILRRFRNGSVVLEQPSSFTREEYAGMEEAYYPKYSLPQGLSAKTFVRIMRQVCRDYPYVEDDLSDQDREKLALELEDSAIRNIHFPADKAQLLGARDRLVFDEFFSFLIAIRKQRAAGGRLENDHPMLPSALPRRLIEALPYALTGAQQRAWEEIEADLTGPYVMNRLLQGDVGSGKTILAFLALLLTAANGRQGALMAPTEVLAEQHMEALRRLVREHHLDITPALLTGSVKGKERKAILSGIADGSIQIIIGTHALIQEKVEYRDLSLVITDEQHRFGVRQRESLAGKGESVPVLVMSATPIPRTLAMILYGDLNVSVLDEMPRDRLPIKNLAMSAQEGRERIYRFMYRQIGEGHQVYVICPAIEKNSDREDIYEAGDRFADIGGTEMENVVDYTAHLQEVFPKDVVIASLHGRMKPAEKSRVMNEFAAGHIDILVSTTVIEVGINVPNATVMLVENAERFGLSQLHQLRGRVGRGRDQSYCIFLYTETETGEKPRRLAILEKTNDGFEIAQEDLKLRGPGDLFGVRQSGEMGFVLADIYEDADLLHKAAAHADKVLEENPDFTLKNGKSVDFRSI